MWELGSVGVEVDPLLCATALEHMLTIVESDSWIPSWISYDADVRTIQVLCVAVRGSIYPLIYATLIEAVLKLHDCEIMKHGAGMAILLVDCHKPCLAELSTSPRCVVLHTVIAHRCPYLRRVMF